MPNRSVLLVTFVWIGLVIASVLSGLSAADKMMIGAKDIVIEMPTRMAFWLSLGAFLFSFLVSFTRRSGPPTYGVMVVVWVLDKVFGDNSVSPFERLIRVDLLFAAGITVYGLVGLTTAYIAPPGSSSYFMSSFGLCFGLGFFSSYALSVKFPPTIW